jgi:membrane protease YdiL (CAAX protease family)
MNTDQVSGVRTITTLLVAVAIFIVAVLLPKLFLSGPVPMMATTQGLELILALGAIALLGKGKFSDYGFRLPEATQSESVSKRHWVLFGLGAMLVGMIATVAMLTSGAGGNPLIKKLTFPQIILFVWFFSSTIEEVFTRGFIQSHLGHLSHIRIRILGCHVTLPVLISALFFASMHLVLLVAGADLMTVGIVWLFTFSVGLMAGYQRAVTGSLIPAIGVHFLANVGGVIGGIVYAVIRIMTGGTLPQV